MSPSQSLTLASSDAEAEEAKVDLNMSGRMAAAVVSGLDGAEAGGTEQQPVAPAQQHGDETVMSEATASPSQVQSFFEQSL